MMKQSPLFATYRDYPGVKLVDFAGWELPLNFQAGIIAEHLCVRRDAGLFDVSHMGEVEITGAGAEQLIDWLVTNDVAAMKPGQALYTPMCYPNGGVVDDLLVYRRAVDRFMLVVNASNTEKDLRWIREEAPVPAELREGRGGNAAIGIVDRSDAIALIALQGPKAAALLGKVVDVELGSLAGYRFLEEVSLFGGRVILSRTGYTGEDGFEIFVAAGEAPKVWTELMDLAAPSGILPCGLGARDTLRIEARLPLYGHELSPEIMPLEAGLKAFVKLDKRDFCGREALLAMKERGVPRSLRGFRMIDKGVPRAGYPVFLDGERIGTVTSGLKSPTLGAFIGLALLRSGMVEQGTEIEVEIASKRKRAQIVKTPFYRNTGGKV